ncbi:uncharacterized protein LOC125646654 isoform X2 [Ostrea edulis]|nr:uncharacterized protein LOC125646654 isoform X2 [Ostrea edulis]
MQHSKMDKLKEMQSRPRIQNKETLSKQPLVKNVKPKIHPVGTKHLTHLSMNKDQSSKRKTSDSNPSLPRKNITKKDKDRKQRTLCGTPKPGKKRILQGTPKPMLTSKAPEKEVIWNKSNQKQKARKQSRVRILKNSDQTTKEALHLNTQQSTEAKHCRISKAKMIQQSSTKTAHKLVTETDDPLLLGRERSAPKYFSTLFLEKIDARFYPEASKMSKIHGISVSNDNLIWVNGLRLRGNIQLLNTSGEILRTIDLDHGPVFNCCTPSGDLLETQGNNISAKPVITMISRDGKSRVLADLSSYATNLYGILCVNETIFVVGYSKKPDINIFGRRYFIMKLSMSGEVQRVYNPEEEYEDINHLIFLNGQIIALRSNGFVMLPLKGEMISSEKMNGVCIERAYSASASVDNLGNVIVASNTELFIIHPSLEFMHKIDTGIGSIISTAIDKNNQLWLGTASGELYSAQYLK